MTFIGTIFKNKIVILFWWVQPNLTLSIKPILEGVHPSNPAYSCAMILHSSPSSPSDFYWIKSITGTPIRVYCDMNRTCGNITGGWTRVTKLDMRDDSSQCPSGFCLDSTFPRTCRLCQFSAGCSSLTYAMDASYNKVCGKTIAYQVGDLEAHSFSEADYDRIQFTFGNPRKHIWTFAVANSEEYSLPGDVCPCINPKDIRIPHPPSFVGEDYFCDTGYEETDNNFYSSNPLWDGFGCKNNNVCCTFNNPPWFFKQLPYTTNEDMEMRVCRTNSRKFEDFAIESIEIFVQ